MNNALSEFVSILVSGIQGVAEGVASGVTTMAKELFLEETEGTITGLSVFGGVIAIFAGLSLAIAITTRVYLWVTHLGK